MVENTTLKHPLPGYGIAIIDANEDDGDDKFDTPQVGKLFISNPTKKDMDNFDYHTLINKRVYWKKYADQDATFFDRELQQDIVFIKLESIVGFED